VTGREVAAVEEDIVISEESDRGLVDEGELKIALRCGYVCGKEVAETLTSKSS